MPLSTAYSEATMIENMKLLAREFTDRLHSYSGKGHYDRPVGANGRIWQTDDTSTPKHKKARFAYMVKYNCDLYAAPFLWEAVKTMGWGTEAGGVNAATFAKGHSTALSSPILDLIQPLEADKGRVGYGYYIGGYAKVAGDAGYDPTDPIINLEFKLESDDAYTAEFTNRAGDRKTRPNTPYSSYILNIHIHQSWSVPEFMLGFDTQHIND